MLKIKYKFDDPFIEKEITLNSKSIKSKILPYKIFKDNLSKSWKVNYLLGKKIKYQLSKDINIVDLCSSIGGLSLGVFEAAKSLGMHPRATFAADIDNEALDVYKINFSPMFAKNISISELVDFGLKSINNEKIFSYEPEILDVDLMKQIGNVDVFLAGPPCQGHSNLNNSTRRNDPRNNLYLDAVAIAIALKSKNIIIENVRTVTKDHKNVIELTRKILQNYNYNIEEVVINADDIGGGQTRIRHFMLASIDKFICANEIVKKNQWPKMNLKDIIDEVPILLVNEVLLRKADYNEENIKRINYLFDNNLYDLPDHVRPDCHKDGNHGYNSVYGRLKWDLPSPTITTGFSSPGRGRYVHPAERRTINAHEASRIQGFPDSFQFGKDLKPTKATKWIGDAVPSSLSYITGLSVLSSYFN
jgi:DNA (cytosine-5)-methyltransferase 1